jgi:hypothetical protein
MCIIAIYQKLVQKIWCPVEHNTLCALCNYCYKSYWGFFLYALPQKFARHHLCRKTIRRVIDVLYYYTPSSLVFFELHFNFLYNFFILGFIVQTVLWLYTTGRKPCNIVYEIHIYGIILSIHRIPPCTLDFSCFTQRTTFLPCLKCGISNIFIMPEL